MSLTPTSRLTSDSIRSPVVAVTTRAAPKIAPCHQAPSSRNTKLPTPAATPASREPAKPSQDFFGLIDGAIGWRPKRTPATYPPVSEHTTASRNAMVRAAPSGESTSNAAKEAKSGT